MTKTLPIASILSQPSDWSQHSPLCPASLMYPLSGNSQKIIFSNATLWWFYMSIFLWTYSNLNPPISRPTTTGNAADTITHFTLTAAQWRSSCPEKLSSSLKDTRFQGSLTLSAHVQRANTTKKWALFYISLHESALSHHVGQIISNMLP